MNQGGSISISIKPSEAVIKAMFARLSTAIADRRRINKQISVMLDRWVQLNFRKEGEPVGKWKDLALGGRWKTNKRGKAFFQTDYKILQDTGALRRSFIPFADATQAGIGSQLKYSFQHEFGDPSKSLPQRRMLPRAKEITDDVVRIYDTWVKATIRK